MSANYSPAAIFATKFTDLLHLLLKRSVGTFGRCIGYTATELWSCSRVPVKCIDLFTPPVPLAPLDLRLFTCTAWGVAYASYILSMNKVDRLDIPYA